MSSKRLVFLAVLAPLISLGPAARADAIDGEWCAEDGRYMSIQGASIRTPGGTRMTGIYDRHGFYYEIPEGEPHAGHGVTMVLMNEYTVHLQVDLTAAGGGEAPIEIWHRCTPKTS